MIFIIDRYLNLNIAVKKQFEMGFIIYYLLNYMQKTKYQQYLAISQPMLKNFKQMYNSKKWEKYSGKPCDMFWMQIQGRIASRGQTIVNYPLQQVFESLSKHQHLKGTDPLLNTYEYLERFPEDKYLNVQYLRYNNVLIVSSRDFVSLTRAVKEGNIIYFFSESLPTYPKQQVNGSVRGLIIAGGHVLQRIDDKRTKVTYISDVDLKGMIPQFVKNIISQKQGQIVSKIQEYMNKEKALMKK